MATISARIGFAQDVVYFGSLCGFVLFSTLITANETEAQCAREVSLQLLDGTDGFRLEGFTVDPFDGECPGSCPGDIPTARWAQFGLTLTGSFDLDGDGTGDIIVGAPEITRLCPSEATRPGDNWVVWGRPQTMPFPAVIALIDLWQLPNVDDAIVLDGDDDNSEETGIGVERAGSGLSFGDVDNDGTVDLILGARRGLSVNDDFDEKTGRAYVVFGGAQPFAGFNDLEDSILSRSIRGVIIYGDRNLPDSNTGEEVVSGGDLDGDGIDDILIGAPDAPDGGRAYLVFGWDLPQGEDPPTEIDLTAGGGFVEIRALDTGFDLIGEVFTVGDLNADTQDDLVVGSPRAGTSNHGRVFVVFGPIVADINDIEMEADITLVGTGDNARAGRSLDISEITGDDNEDLLIGAPGFSGDHEGVVYVIHGGESPYPGTIELSDLDKGIFEKGFRIASDLTGGFGDEFGFDVAARGDFNDDGYCDVAIGAPVADVGENFDEDHGRAFLLLGRGPGDSFPAEVDVSVLGASRLAIYNGFTPLPDEEVVHTGWAVALGDDVNGDGRDDLVIGAPQVPWQDGGGCWHLDAGNGYVVFGLRADPEDVTVTAGTLESGGVLHVARADGLSLIVRSTLGPPKQMKFVAGFDSVFSPSEIACLVVTVESRMTQPGGAERVRIHNWTTDQFDLLPNAANAADTDDRARVFDAADASDYVRADGRIEIEFEHILSVSQAFSPFRSHIDLVHVRQIRTQD